MIKDVLNDLNKSNSSNYKIDTLKNKKLRIKNCYNETVINKTFDSIAYNSFFLVGYNNNNNQIDIYSHVHCRQYFVFSLGSYKPRKESFEFLSCCLGCGRQFLQF